MFSYLIDECELPLNGALILFFLQLELPAQLLLFLLLMFQCQLLLLSLRGEKEALSSTAASRTKHLQASSLTSAVCNMLMVRLLSSSSSFSLIMELLTSAAVADAGSLQGNSSSDS